MPELFLTLSMAQSWTERARKFVQGLKPPPSLEPLQRQIPELTKARDETAEEVKRATEDALMFPSKTQDERAASAIRELARVSSALDKAERELQREQKKAESTHKLRLYTNSLVERLGQTAEALKREGKAFTKIQLPNHIYNTLKILGYRLYPEAPPPAPALVAPAIVRKPIFGPPIKVKEPPPRRPRPAPRDVIREGAILPISGCYCRLFSDEDKKSMEKYLKRAFCVNKNPKKCTTKPYFSFINEDYSLKGWVKGNSYDIPASRERRPGEEGIFVVHPSQGYTADMLTWSDIIQMGMRKWPCYCKGNAVEETLPDPQTGEQKDWVLKRATCYSFAGTVSYLALVEEAPFGVFAELREFPKDLKKKHMEDVTFKDVKEKGHEWFIRTLQERLDDEDRQRWEFLKEGMAQLRNAVFGYYDEKEERFYRGMEDIIAGCPISLGEELAKKEYAEPIKAVAELPESLEETRLREEAQEAEALEEVIEELKIPTEAPSE